MLQGQILVCCYAIFEWRDLAGPRHATGSVGGRLDAALEIFADGLAVEPGAARDSGDAHALPVQVQDHHKLPKSDHASAPSDSRGKGHH